MTRTKTDLKYLEGTTLRVISGFYVESVREFTKGAELAAKDGRLLIENI